MPRRAAVCIVLFVAVFGLMGPAQGQDTMEALPIELPDPNYGSTPLDYTGENYEERDYRDWPPFLAPKGASNVALHKPVTASTGKALTGKLEMATDGEKEYDEANVVEIDDGYQYIQIDLGEPCDLYAILFWHYHANERVYFDVAIQVAEDAEFTQGVITLFNNDHDNTAKAGVGKDQEYLETHKGKLIDAKGVTARYVRLYSNGNTSDSKNHYTEVEVWGKAAK